MKKIKKIKRIIIKLLSYLIFDKTQRENFIDKYSHSRDYVMKQYGKKLVQNLVALLSHESEINPVELLKENLSLIEIEVFSFCNRRCWFCPNSFIDRHSENNYMDEKLYLKLLSDLREINYSGILTYSRYNEPFSDRIILKRLEQAKKYIPNAILYSHSNGDYFNKEYLDELGEAGLKVLKWQYYINESEEFNTSIIYEKMKERLEKLGLKHSVIRINESEVILKVEHSKIDIEYWALNYKEFGCNRGGTLSTIPSFDRKSPCYIPFGELYVDYTGFVMPCCNLRSDIPEHKKYIVGNANEESLSEIFTSKKIVNLRKILIGNDEKPYPCSTCKFGTWTKLKGTDC